MYSRLQKTTWRTVNTQMNLYRRFGHSNAVKRRANVSIECDKLYNGFRCVNVEFISEYNMTAYLLQHEQTKTEYLHLERDDSNNVFSVGFRTTPMDSMGTPHILEHTVLCGSEKYPVRDPFFKMLNRSLATFMNALTAPDYTFYPFSSQNEVDYRNLQKVYCDAVFRPNLLRQDFLQEGWRLEHAVLDDKTSPLNFKGVVYNEMKGAFSETSSFFGQKFLNTILPAGTYGHVSGGDPIEIPELTHSHLKEFHAKHYHPSNSRVYSYGNFPLEENLKFLNDHYFSQCEYLDPGHTFVQPNPRWQSPKKASLPCRVDQYGGPAEKQNQIAIGYILSDVTDVYETFMLTAMSELMIIGPNSAFYKSLIEKNISGGYNSLTGYENQIRDTLFTIGLRDLERKNFALVEEITNETLEDIYKNGFETDHIQSVLHGFELAIKHQSPKFGMNVLFNLMPLWNHNGQIMEAMKVNNLLGRLKEDLFNPDYVRSVIDKYFLNNNHKLVMTLEPDPKFDEKLNESEKKLLNCKVSLLTEKDRETIFKDGIQLSKAQKKVENLEVLPCLKLDEIILNKTSPALKHTASGSVPLQLCEANTNGVTYFKGVLGTESLTQQQRSLVPLFNYILDKFDTNNFSYRDFDKHITKSTSGLNVSSHITEHISLPGQYEEGILISSHCLDENLQTMLNIWKEIFNKPNFSNKERFAMLMTSYCSNLTGGIIQNGHTYAMQAARSLISTVEECKERSHGINHVMTMQELQKAYSTEDLQSVVTEIGDNVLNGDNLRAAFHYSNTNAEAEQAIDEFCSSICNETEEVHGINWTDCKDIEQASRGLHISMNIPVNFCSKVIPTVPYTDPDYAKLRVLTTFLSSKYLHPLVREQNGAYGGGAAMTLDGAFNFYSYRDPNSRVTLDVFDGSADWMTKNQSLIDDQNLFEAKLSVLQKMDQPIAEYMKGIDLFLYGLSYDIWQTQRERVLAVTKNDLIEVSKKYLNNENWCGRCVIGDGAKQNIQKDGEKWEVISGPTAS